MFIYKCIYYKTLSDKTYYYNSTVICIVYKISLIHIWIPIGVCSSTTSSGPTNCIAKPKPNPPR